MSNTNNNIVNEVEAAPSNLEQFIIKVNDKKHSLGLWYTVIWQRILPFVLFLLPANVICGRAIRYTMQFIPQIYLGGAILLLVWIIVMLTFLAVLIVSPKLATVLELLMGFAYLYFAFHHHLFRNLLGYALLIGVILFLLVKLVFLVFKIVSIRAFAGDEEGVERDETGRIVRATGENVFYLKEDKNSADENVANVSESDKNFLFKTEENIDTDEELVQEPDHDFLFKTEENISEDEELVQQPDDDFHFSGIPENTDNYEDVYVHDKEFLFTKTEENVSEYEETRSADDDFYFVKDNKNDAIDEDERLFRVTDNDFCFTGSDNPDENDRPIPASDNDFFFG